MGVEEIQKINALARELMKHGIVSTSDEALLRAEDMLKPNSVDSMTEAITGHSSIGRAAPSMMSNEALSSLNMDIRSLGVRFDSVAREVLGLKEEIKRLGGNVGDVSQQVTRLSVHGIPTQMAEQRVAAAAPLVAPQAPVQQSFTREPVQQSHFERPKMMNVHTGKEDFKSEDVAIEKIFYFGK